MEMKNTKNYDSKFVVELGRSLFEATVLDRYTAKDGAKNIYYQGSKETATWVCAAMNHYSKTVISLNDYVSSLETIKIVDGQ
jgi:hypothetical protein